MTNHSLRALRNLGPAPWTSGFYSLELVSHKLLRHLAPLWLLPLLASSLALAGASRAMAALALFPLASYAVGALGFALRRTRLGRLRLLSVPYFFAMVNAAALVGVVSVVRGRRLRAWQPRGGLGGGGAL